MALFLVAFANDVHIEEKAREMLKKLPYRTGFLKW
jgi:hypothetical protein